MTLSLVVRLPIAARRRWVVLVTCLVIVCCGGVRSKARAQAAPHAEANQLHGAIVNGDVESLRYWLTVRHADASAANDAEPDVTPLGRCLGLAARVLGTSADADRDSQERSNRPVSLRTLQDMVTLLHEHGARLVEVDRRRFAGPVLRWYDDAVSPRSVADETKPGAAPPAPPVQPAAAPATQPLLSLGRKPVSVSTSPRESCNGKGHAVYLVNQSELSVTANVTTLVDATETTNGSQQRDTYTVNPDGVWRLGCDTLKDGRPVHYVLNTWR